MKDLTAEMRVILGRVNGVEAALYVIAKHLPPSSALLAAAELRASSEAVTADALATPIHDSTIQEMRRVMAQVARFLDSAANQSQ